MSQNVRRLREYSLDLYPRLPAVPSLSPSTTTIVPAPRDDALFLHRRRTWSSRQRRAAKTTTAHEDDLLYSSVHDRRPQRRRRRASTIDERRPIGPALPRLILFCPLSNTNSGALDLGVLANATTQRAQIRCPGSLSSSITTLRALCAFHTCCNDRASTTRLRWPLAGHLGLEGSSSPPARFQPQSVHSNPNTPPFDIQDVLSIPEDLGRVDWTRRFLQTSLERRSRCITILPTLPRPTSRCLTQIDDDRSPNAHIPASGRISGYRPRLPPYHDLLNPAILRLDSQDGSSAPEGLQRKDSKTAMSMDDSVAAEPLHRVSAISSSLCFLISSVQAQSVAIDLMRLAKGIHKNSSFDVLDPSPILRHRTSRHAAYAYAKSFVPKRQSAVWPAWRVSVASGNRAGYSQSGLVMRLRYGFVFLCFARQAALSPSPFRPTAPTAVLSSSRPFPTSMDLAHPVSQSQPPPFSRNPVLVRPLPQVPGFAFRTDSAISQRIDTFHPLRLHPRRRPPNAKSPRSAVLPLYQLLPPPNLPTGRNENFQTSSPTHAVRTTHSHVLSHLIHQAATSHADAFASYSRRKSGENGMGGFWPNQNLVGSSRSGAQTTRNEQESPRLKSVSSERA
ncbi:hypothetical protein EIP91_006355 [Steccherinum ochraceum]|uniref:Uncharacterized protein n=1 Tax=Steccherinum ochraceum TaxID=92696 RepID=A0A4R0R640_9APHY|nr:hypothetical protein EIP91_006355 [Steccherinum ochraceum]